jgi:hypothetical protein
LPAAPCSGRSGGEGDAAADLESQLEKQYFRSSLREAFMSTTVAANGRSQKPSESFWDCAGTKVDFRLGADGNVMMVRVDGEARREKFSKLRGQAGKGMTTDEIMALTRGET